MKSIGAMLIVLVLSLLQANAAACVVAPDVCVELHQTNILLTLLLAGQGIPVRTELGGTVTGTLKMADGSPAAGARVAAALRPDSGLDVVSDGALISIAQADANGHFQLENIPQGRYLITAGRV